MQSEAVASGGADDDDDGSGGVDTALATSAAEAARQAEQLRMLAARPYAEFSVASPFRQLAGDRLPVLHAAEPRLDDKNSSASVCVRGRRFFAGLPHIPTCEICDEHTHSSRFLFDRYFGAAAGEAWRGRGVYIESGALDGNSGAHSLFFDEVMQWRGLLIEGNPPNFARALARRPHAVRLECALCARGGRGRNVEFVGDHGGVVGAASAMGDDLRSAFHGERADRYNVSCCALRTFWPLAALGSLVHVWFLDVEGSELNALRSVDWLATGSVRPRLRPLSIETRPLRTRHPLFL